MSIFSVKGYLKKLAAAGQIAVLLGTQQFFSPACPAANEINQGSAGDRASSAENAAFPDKKLPAAGSSAGSGAGAAGGEAAREPVPAEAPGKGAATQGASEGIEKTKPLAVPDSAAQPPKGNSEAALSPEQEKIKSLEERLFSRDFSFDKAAERLSRVEKFVFGVESKGENAARLQKLMKVFGKSGQSHETSDSGKPAATEGPRALLSMINDGIDNYNKHRFHNAEDDFNQALKLAPGMSRIHVYLGSTLLQLNERQAAIDAMNTAYELDPFGTYGRYAKHCLVSLMGDEEVRQRGPKDNMKVVEKTLEGVNKKAAQDAQRLQAEGQKTAVTRSRPAVNYDMDYARQSYLRSDSAIQQARARTDAAQRAANTQEAANNLKALITSKVMPGDAKLRAFGTTLNARYYGSETFNIAPYYIPREAPPQELKAQPVLLKAARRLNLTGKTEGTAKEGTRAEAKKAAPSSQTVLKNKATKSGMTKSGTKPAAAKRPR